ncbi:MAG TPA: hypothetical protein VJO35_08700 [Terriglobales bacterium]|nr:hypothetical protein [Terriglobales bacterium]
MPRSLYEFHFTRLLRFRPDAFSHNLSGHRVLMFAGLLRQVHEWAILRFQILNRIVNLFAIKFVQTRDQALKEI